MKTKLAIIIIVVAAALIIGFLHFSNDKAPSHALAAAQPGEIAPNVAFVLSNGTNVSLSQCRGKTVLLWFVSTWCGSCAQGTEALQSNSSFFRSKGVTILEVETYKNLGYNGPPMSQFMLDFARQAYLNGSIIAGYAGQEAMEYYDSKGYPDIYYLIAKNGTITYISGSPAATMTQLENAINGL